MAEPGAVPRSVILLVVLLVQFCPRTLKAVSTARYAPAVVSPEETGRTWGASLVPRDVGAAGSKLERRLSDDREESTRGAAHEDTGNESVQVNTNKRPLGPHGHHHHPCPSDGKDGQSGSRSNGRKGGDGGGCGGGQGGQGSEGDGSRSPSGDEEGGRYGGDGGDGGDGGWTKDTYAKRFQKNSVSKGNGGNENGPSAGPTPGRPGDCRGGSPGGRRNPGRSFTCSGGPGDGRGNGGPRYGKPGGQ